MGNFDFQKLMKWGRGIWCVAAVWGVVALSVGCGTARREAPVAVANERVQQGRVVFMRECHHCHPGGAAGLGPALNNKPLPRFAIRAQVRRGLGVMPAFDEGQISGEELASLVEYLKALRAAGAK